jgi:hypothetical protein
MSASAAA